VDPPKGPVLLNYGIEECRFLKPVYPGSTCHPWQACPGHRTGDPGQVKLIPAQGRDRLCREKLDQEKRRKLSGPPRSLAFAGTADSPKGADPAGAGQAVVDETGETVTSRGLGSDDLDDGEKVGPVVGTYHPEHKRSGTTQGAERLSSRGMGVPPRKCGRGRAFRCNRSRAPKGITTVISF